LSGSDIKLSVIIPAFDEEEFIGDTIDNICERLSQLKGVSGEIIVVDNNSTDKTSEIAKSKGAKVVFEANNQISKARNVGAAKAVGEYLFFIDADTLIPEILLGHALSKLVSENWAGGGVPNLWKFISVSFKVAAGSFIFCRKEYFEEVGGFSEKLFAGEEIHFSHQYKKLCRKKGDYFGIIDQYPVITSSRKLSFFSPLKILSAILIPLIFPWALRYKSMCWFWYNRPKK
jgi:glycosyltransferase involved in cell wall biosynthesis